MDPESRSNEDTSNNSGPITLAPAVITPPKHVSGGPLSDLAGWSVYSKQQSGAPGREGMVASTDFQRSSVHLPTPQSPATLSSYLLPDNETPGLSDHGVRFSQHSSMLPTEFHSYTTPSPPPPRSQQILTPESSPLLVRSRGSSQQQLVGKNSQDPTLTAPTEFRDPALHVEMLVSTAIAPMPSHPTTPEAQEILSNRGSPLHDDAPHIALPYTPPRKLQPSLPQSQDGNQNSSTLPTKVNPEIGSEAAWIRAQLAENHLALAQEAEARRPDYLKRTKRTAPDLEVGATANGMDQASVLQPAVSIGITESPIKGRRLTLFQETSDESFEESLMAGGYGRYRFDAVPWRQSENEAPNAIEATVEPSEMSERERKKKSRLAAFLDTPLASSSKTQLVPLEVEGCGRVLVNVDAAEPPTSPKPSPSKGRRSRRKKKATPDARGEKDGALGSSEAKVDGPNWPDTQFPWDSQSSQGRLQNLEEEERLRHIENFLDRDTDEDEIEEGPSSPVREPEEEIRAGRGKMYSVLRHSADGRSGKLGPTATSVILGDPADARAALMSKKSVRDLSLRLLRRRNTDNDGGGGETVCICNDPDDERASVQCDACQIWYHLDCIGIQSTLELGREEDPWFCANCAETKTPPPVVLSLSEPTLVPTDDKVSVDANYDPPFFQAGLNPSPATPWTRTTRPPRTPPRSQGGPYFSSGSSWDEPSSCGGPHTPQIPSSQEVRVYSTPGRVGPVPVEESPFDPTSTPSRGIKFGAPFATPKNGPWTGRSQDLFHTPTRPDGVGFSRQFGQYASKGSKEETSTVSLVTSGNSLTQDFTPVVRNLRLDNGRLLESPLAAKRSRHSVDIRLSASRENAKQGTRRV